VRFRVRRAKINPIFRQHLEQFGAPVVAAVLAAGSAPRHENLARIHNNSDLAESAAKWLTEQYDRDERKESWSIIMEAAITVFVLVEMTISIVEFRDRSSSSRPAQQPPSLSRPSSPAPPLPDRSVPP